jgi:tetratricopeptide (TPR) repeat protein
MGGAVTKRSARVAALTAALMWPLASAWAQTAAAPAVPPAAAIDQLAEQAQYWETRGRYDLAREAWLKLLRIDANSEQALAGLALAEAKSGRTAAAQVYLGKLREADPDSVQIKKIDDAIRNGSFDSQKLEGPRTLARQGKFAEAIAAYKSIFGDDVPDGRLGLEYYQTLAGTADGWGPARDGIANLANTYPDEPIYQLALAQHLTYREETRRDGIAQLARLSPVAGVGKPADEARRQALLWLGAKPGDEKLYTSYLADHKDEQVAAKLATLRSSTAPAKASEGYPGAVAPRPPTEAEIRGQEIKAAYDLLNTGELAQASAAFETLIARYPDADDAYGGLGIVRLRQERYGEARAYLQQASAMAPKRAGRWKEALSSARFWEQVRAATAAREAGDLPRAEALLRSAISTDPDIAAQESSVKATLADVLAEGGEVEEAERLYRDILSRDPADVNATRGLIGILTKSNRIGEALSLADRLPPDAKDQLGNIGALKGQYLRDQAKLATDAKDYAQAEQLLKQALLEDPESPWTRLDLSRIYQQQKRIREANTLIDGLLTGGKQMPEAIYIKALLLAEQDNWFEGLRILEQIPYEQRTQPMADLQRRMWVRYQTSRASVYSRYGRPQEAMTILQQVEPYAQDSPELLGAMATALADTGQDGRALNYIRQALSRQSTPDPGLRLQYASLLFKLRQDAEFEVVMEDLIRMRNWDEQQSLDLANLRVAYRLRQADLVREEGDLARAYEYLDPLLKVNPNDPRLIMALARLYTDAKEHDKAATLYRRALQTDPNNIDAYKGAIGAALSLNQIDEAQALIDRALSIDPQNPRLFALAARAARARGEDGRALQLYQQALKLDQMRGGESEFGDGRYTPQLYLLDPATTPMYSPSYGAISAGKPVAFAPVSIPAEIPSSVREAVAAISVKPAVAAAIRVAERASPHARPPPTGSVPNKPSRPHRQQGDYALVAVPRWWHEGRLVKVSTAPSGQPTTTSRYPSTAVVSGASSDVTVTVPQAPVSSPGWVQTAPDRYTYTLQTPSGSSVGVPYGAVQSTMPSPMQSTMPSEPVAGLPRYVPRQLAPSTELTAPKARPRETFREEMLRNIGEITGEGGQTYAQPQTQPTQPLPQTMTPTYTAPQIPPGAPRYPAAAARLQAQQQYVPQATLPMQTVPAQSLSLQTYPIQTAPPTTVYSPAPGLGATVEDYNRQGLRVLPGAPQPTYVPQSVPSYVPVQPQPTYVQQQPLPQQPTYVQSAPVQTYAPAPQPTYPAAAPLYGVDLRSDPALSTPDFVMQRRRTAADQPNEVLREIAELNAKRSAYASFGFAVRSRDGVAGLDRLNDLELPVEMSVAGVNAGRFKLRAVPVFLDAGTVSGQAVPLFGAMGLVDDAESYSFDQNESGIALGAAYQIADFQADFGSSPLGFPVENLVGGINWRPSLGPVSFKLDLSRRSVTDSLLSYAGTVDPATGNTWGGVTKNGGRLDLAFDFGQYGLYGNGSYHVLDGENVARNSVYEIGGGFYARALDRRDMRITYGVNLTTFFYDKNLRRFTYGHGGYFSPQSYFAVAIPVEWSGGRNRFSYKLNAALGVQSFKEDGQAAFPNDPVLQDLVETFVIDNPDTNTVGGYSSQSSTGIGFNFSGAFEYLIAPNLVAGARFGIDNARDYEEAHALGYIRYFFLGQRSAAMPPNTLLPYYDFGDPTL